MVSYCFVNGQGVCMGSNGNAAIFTTAGAVAMDGQNFITGNVGTNAGAISQSAGTNVNGNVDNVDAKTAQQVQDLQTTYNKLQGYNGMLRAAAIGDETITPGVYEVGSASTFSGTIIFDAQNDKHALFVLKIGGALSGSANMQLVNGAQAENIFFVVNGAISIGGSSIIKGTYIANNAAISVATSGTNIEGRLLSTTGAISISDAEMSTPLNTTLAINLLYFNGCWLNGNVFLNWQSEMGGIFTIQKSANQLNWHDIGNSYKFYKDIDGGGYYRLRQGTDYSKTIYVNGSNTFRQLPCNILGQFVTNFPTGIYIINNNKSYR